MLGNLWGNAENTEGCEGNWKGHTFFKKNLLPLAITLDKFYFTTSNPGWPMLKLFKSMIVQFVSVREGDILQLVFLLRAMV